MDTNSDTPSRLGALRDGLRSLLRRRPEEQPTQILAGDEEAVREAMLAILPATDARHSLRLVTLRRRIQYAADCDALWYLRADVLTVLADADGEAQARTQLATLDRLFPRRAGCNRR